MGVGDTALFGYSTILGVGEETTYGTLATATNFIEFNSESLKRSIEFKNLESINTTRDYQRRMTMNEAVDGAIECDFNLASDFCLYLLKHALGGTVSSATISAGAITHTFNLGDMESNKGTSSAADMKGLTFMCKKGGKAIWSFQGCRINQLTIKAEVGNPVTMNVEVIGKTATITSTDTLTATYSGILPLNFSGITFQTGNTTSSYSSESIMSLEWTINNNLVNDTNARELGSRTVKILPPTRREVSLKYTQRFDTITAYNRFIEQTITACKITFDTGVTIAAAATTYSMYVQMPRLYFNANLPEVADAGVLTQNLEAIAIKDPTSTAAAVCSVVVHNAATNY